MNKKLTKAVSNKSRVRNKYLTWLSRENVLAYEKVKSKRNSVNKKAKKSSFQKATKNVITSNNFFKMQLNPLMTIKRILTDDKIVIESENKGAFEKHIRFGGGEWVLKKRTKTNRGSVGGQGYL